LSTLPQSRENDDRRKVKLPPYAQHRRAIDWGASVEHPFVCLWGAKDNSGHWYIYDEYWDTSQTKTAIEHFQVISSRHPWPTNSTYHGVTYADPSRPDMFRLFSSIRVCPDCFMQVMAAGKGECDQVACQQCEWTGLKRELIGMSITAAKNAVYEGIECVRRHLKVDADEKPLLQISEKRCPKLTAQMSTYRWHKSSGKGTNPQAAKPSPLKANDDSVDALRYLLYSEYVPPGAQLKAMREVAPVRRAVQYQRRERR
jgi:hypothetical protein